MPWLLFLLALISITLTYTVYRPNIDHERLSVISFFLGMPMGEFALHFIAVQAILSILMIYFNALSGWAGQAGLVMLVGSWTALALDYRASLTVNKGIEKALCSGLGADYRSKIETTLKECFSERLYWRDILLPLPIRNANVVRQKNIPYSRVKGINLKLDVYRHRSLPSHAPTLVWVHGGAWIIGSKNEQGLPFINHMAAKGWTCVSVNYRLSPHATFPEQLIDLKYALRWLRENHKQHGIDPNFIVTTGGSAGGHLASLLTLTANQPEFQPGFEKADTSVNGCVSFYGIYDFTNRNNQFRHGALRKVLQYHVMKASLAEAPEAYRRASPIDWLNNNDLPAFLVIHGRRDSLVPVEEARHFTKAFRHKSSGPLVYFEIPGAQHAFEMLPSPRAQAAIHGTERFLAYLYSQYLASNRPV